MASYKLPEGTPVKIKVKRVGEIVELEGEVKTNYAEGPGFKFVDESKKALKNKWLHD